MSDLVDRFLAQLPGRRATGERTAAADAAAHAVAQIVAWGSDHALLADDPLVDELGLPDALTAAGVHVARWPEGRDGGWRGLLGLEGSSATVGVTVPTLAVARRGTLLLSTGPGHGRSIDVVSERHLALLPASRVRATLGEALAERFAAGGRPPSAVSLVSGPSRTSDIEKISTLGAHGALSQHVVVIDDR